MYTVAVQHTTGASLYVVLRERAGHVAGPLPRHGFSVRGYAPYSFDGYGRALGHRRLGCQRKHDFGVLINFGGS